jgi:hypothetical protein
VAVLVTSDWHLNSKPRDRYRHEWVRGQLPALIKERKVHTLLMLGDLTDEYDNHPASLVNDIVDHLTMLSGHVGACAVCGGSGFSGRGTGYDDVCGECGGQRSARRGPYIYLMRGNHDYVDAGTPFFRFTSAIPGLRWINSPCVLDIEDIGRTLFLPHTRDHKADWAGVDFGKADICLAHNTFDGTISEAGQTLSGIPPSAIPTDLPTYSGDIHKRQKVGHITYVGAPYTVDFGDAYKPRVLLFTDDAVQSIPCTGAQKRLIEADVGKGHVREWLKDAGDDLVKLRVTVGPVEAQNWADIKRSITDEAAKLGVRLHSIEALMHKDAATARQRYKAGTRAKRDDQIVEAYCRDRGVDASLTAEGLAFVRSKGSKSV